MDILAVSFVVDMNDVAMCSFCQLTSMERVPIPNKLQLLLVFLKFECLLEKKEVGLVLSNKLSGWGSICLTALDDSLGSMGLVL